MNCSPQENKGAGNAGRSTRPQPRMQNKKAYEHSHHGHTGFTRHSPRNGFTTDTELFPVIGLCCHRRQRDTTRSLDASIEASEPHDFAVRFRAVRPHSGADIFSSTRYVSKVPTGDVYSMRSHTNSVVRISPATEIGGVVSVIRLPSMRTSLTRSVLTQFWTDAIST